MNQRADRTRARLQTVALELFLEHGFEQTTVAQVAQAAGVSQMTFFRHFPTKESVVLDDDHDPLIVDTVLAQPADLAPFERVRRGLRAGWALLPEPAGQQALDRMRLVTRSTSLRASALHNTIRTEDAVVEALADAGVARLDARVATAACLAAVTGALVEWGSGTTDGLSLADCVVTALDGLPHPVEAPRA